MLARRQTFTLVWKNILIVLIRHAFTTPLRALILPLIFTGFLAYARNLFIPASIFGIAPAVPVRSLPNALHAAGGNRHTVAFVHNGHQGGAIERLIDGLADIVRSAGRQVAILESEASLLTTCPSSIQGLSPCIAAGVFHASPQEGFGGHWNYTLRADGGLGQKIDVTRNDNDAQIYVLPFQHAIDYAIAAQEGSGPLPSTVDEYAYTSQTQQERQEHIRIHYMGGIIRILGVAFFIAIVGVIYQLVGLMASEREIGITQLMEVSMPNHHRWQTQAIRFTAYHLAFDAIFLPGWIGIGLIIGYGVFQQTSLASIVLFNVLTGFSLSSFSLFGAAFFHKSQLSGIATTIIALLLGIVAQVLVNASSAAVLVLSLLFPPMNYTFFTILVARWERQNLPANLILAAPNNTWQVPGIVFFFLTLVHIIGFPILAAWLERGLYGTACKGRRMVDGADDAPAVSITGFSKRYSPRWWTRRSGRTVAAVDALDLTIPQGQIMVLLGANGSGKSTTLDAVAGLSAVSSGTITLNGRGGLGVCPQRNVLWDDLTVMEHVWIFNRLKSPQQCAPSSGLRTLLQDCDLDRKIYARSRHLSGGQKRKLQLSMMLTGDSGICCVDECSSGVDAIARQKLWNILLNERGKRTIIYTTHFLDEADLLSDQIAILSRGCLKAQGSAVELKHRLGQGYRIIVSKPPGESPQLPRLEAGRKDTVDRTTFTVSKSEQAATCIRQLEAADIRNYEITSPTIEEIFFNVAEADLHSQAAGGPKTLTFAKGIVDGPELEEKPLDRPKIVDDILQLEDGRPTKFLHQAWVLVHKRFTVLRRNYLPSAAAMLIPIVAAGLVTLFLKGFTLPGCSPSSTFTTSDVNSLLSQVDYSIAVGPSSRLSIDALLLLGSSLPHASASRLNPARLLSLAGSIHPVGNSLTNFNKYIATNYANTTPGGIFLGDRPTFAYQGNAGPYAAFLIQNIFDTLLTNVSISSQYQAFDLPLLPDIGKTLQLIIYLGLAMSAYPAFFALYPTLERLREVRRLHYSNGVRASTLWLAYLSFDSVIVLFASVIITIIFRAVTDSWYHVGYLFVVLFLYGMASTLLAYVVSMFSPSQLAAYAFAAGGQAVMLLLYFIAYLSVLTYSAVNETKAHLLITHFTIGLVTPVGNLVRALFIALNVFSTACEDRNVIAPYPGAITLYGGPILYLIGQSVLLYLVLVWWDSGSSFWPQKRRLDDREDSTSVEDADVLTEARRVAHSTDGLRVQHVSKSFGSVQAVQDVSFGVRSGEIFALLGPNGAGKSTTISLIRGDIVPSRYSGDVLIEDVSVCQHRALARTRLGVCPQVDACDQMTVLEHLRFYARIRGVVNVEHNVSQVLRAVGLPTYQHRMAAKLSGGNKRKLSLAIALMGNPSVLLLDEPSSGMDVCAKRIMWQTLMAVLPGRSLLLTTHSMEEADALADRAGIMGKRMLAIGTAAGLRQQYGNRCHVHLIMKSAPHTPMSQMERVKTWIGNQIEDAHIEAKTWHGQLRFSVPARDGASGIGKLFTILETHKEDLGFEHYSVSPTTLDQVFLAIVGQHNIEEENFGTTKKQRRWRSWVRMLA